MHHTNAGNVAVTTLIGRGRGRGYNGGSSTTTTSKRYAREIMAFVAKRQATPKEIGVYVNETTRMTIYQSSAVVTIDIGFKPPGLKWKGKNIVTAKQL
ncbi:hypothetical protein JCGZ_07979 [Jatropha curcas]|uniref:Uncharacterized protein n=1 Tax=Jatropha curcas TaxID=180498 RepID=A0A067LEZ2_JATCU|nr:hypothetical protein JCGZ_07979 [Jatropha curcas]